jgi:hypothetical protein
VINEVHGLPKETFANGHWFGIHVPEKNKER